jgi:hypothetical protein
MGQPYTCKLIKTRNQLFVKCCQNWGHFVAPGSVRAGPVYGPDGSRRRGGMSSTQALVWNVRTLLWMEMEMTNGHNHEEEYRCRNKGRSCP